MRLGIKGKQVLGVTSIVGGVVVILSLLREEWEGSPLAAVDVRVVD